MHKFMILNTLLLFAVIAGVYAQNATRKPDDGRSIREYLFKDGKPAPKKVTPKPKEATITSKEALRHHIFPGSNGSGVPRNTAIGARKTGNQAGKGASEIPSNQSAAEAKQKAQDPKATKSIPADLGAQGKEPPLHFEKPKTPTSKN